MENDIMVSVCCLAYNHSKYIKQCLDGFVNQKTNFKFEVLVHDDASTDGTQDIIREYEKKYPDIIKPIYQAENQYSKGIKVNATYQYPRVKGKYIAYCEGDDFWSNVDKLQKQFDIMEKNPDCSAVFHKVNDITETGEALSSAHPRSDLNSGIIKSEKLVEMICSSEALPFQLSSYFMRNIFNSNSEQPKFRMASIVGDISLALWLAAIGDVYYIDESMSCYRCFSQGGWTEKWASNIDLRIKTRKSIMDCLNLYNQYTEYRFNKIIEKRITEDEFIIYQLEHNYKQCLKRKYKNQFRLLNNKEKINVILSALFPHLMDYYRTRGKKNE